MLMTASSWRRLTWCIAVYNVDDVKRWRNCLCCEQSEQKKFHSVQ